VILESLLPVRTDFDEACTLGRVPCVLFAREHARQSLLVLEDRESHAPSTQIPSTEQVFAREAEPVLRERDVHEARRLVLLAANAISPVKVPKVLIAGMKKSRRKPDELKA
jgi:hypothetical protein